MTSKGSSSQCWGEINVSSWAILNLSKINIVQEHIDTAQVVGRQVDFLTEEALPDILFAQNLSRLQQQGPEPQAGS